VTLAVWLAPDRSTYATLILAPGFSETTSAVILVGDEMIRPLIAVITSPATRPAEAAGPPDTTPAIRAPDPEAT
jgi:hypothetical protein